MSLTKATEVESLRSSRSASLAVDTMTEERDGR